MSHAIKKSLIALSVSGVLFAPSAFATNGMNLEGYGPIATGMGGASMAYDNGAAVMANNPATLGLMNDGESQLDVAIGVLAPDISTSIVNDNASSGGPYLMPAGGWVMKKVLIVMA